MQYTMSIQTNLLFIITFVVCTVNCANILFLAGLPSPSHHIWFRAFAYGLAKDGNHNITVLSTDIETKPPANIHYIQIEGIYDILYGKDDEAANFNLTELVMKDASHYEDLKMFSDFCSIVCEASFQTNGMKTLLNYPDNFKFDLIIHDYTCGPCLLFLMEKFNNPPLISATAFLNPPFTLDLVGGHKHYAYVPFYGVNYDSDMNFYQRIGNVFLHAMSFLHRKFEMIPHQDAIARKNIQWDFPYLSEIEQKTVLALINTHPSFDVAEPLPPNVIPVGGLQIQEPKKLPDDLEQFINASEKGAILFSLGTNIKSNALGSDIQMKFLKAFEQMPQYNFLWKFETDTLPMKPSKNVLIRPWMPQNDLLGHPKIVLFITHSGGLSTIEASWYGVPLVAIPFMGDQHKNTFKSVKTGVAEKINILTVSIEEIKEKVLKVIEDTSYGTRMKVRSLRFRDQPEKPIDRAVWWVNWVLRNPIPEHIQSPVMKLGFIRSNCYDLLAVAALILLITAYSMVKVVSLFRGKKISRKNAKKIKTK